MSSLNSTATTAAMVSYLSGKRTRVIRHAGTVTVWHGGKKHEFSTNKGAAMYVEKLYQAYKAM